MGILFAIIIFSIVVFIHELGHFLFAKYHGICVFEFSIGMGPKLLAKQWGETLYCIKALPLGGSCMMGEDLGGEEDSEVEYDIEETEEDYIEIRQGNFNEKSIGARMSVIFGGPLFNFILAFICAIIMVSWIGYDASTIAYVGEDSPAYDAGLEVGDTITKLNSKNINLWREVSTYLEIYPSDDVEVQFVRDGVKYKTELTPILDEESGRYLMGISGGTYENGSILDTLKYSVYTVKYYMLAVVDSLKLLISGAVSMEEVSGPVGIVDQVGETYTQSVQLGWDYVLLNMIHLLILLSANLGIMNLLPIPALDGGRLVFLCIEGVRGKRLSAEKEGMIHLIGFGALMLLMVVVMYNDIMRLFQ